MSEEQPEDLVVEIGEGRSYPIRFVESIADKLSRLVVQYMDEQKGLVVVTDMNLAVAQALLFDDILKEVPTFTVSPGESSKNLLRLGEIWDFLANIRLDRKGAVIAIGGGVIGDLAGFASASFLRGTSYFQVPTTLLAMVDSSIGGKTGINLEAGKNLVGAFFHPEEVLIDTTLLKTLPDAEFSAGMAEVIKYGLLGDAELFSRLEDLDRLHPEHPELASIIRRCCSIKAAVVSEDEQETATAGGRALLNLGHTFGHAIENVSGYGIYLHGEAVSIGMVAAARMSCLKGWIPEVDVGRIVRLLKRYDLPVCLRQPLDRMELLEAMRQDKKVRRGVVHFVAMRQLGDSFTTSEVEEHVLLESLEIIGAE